MSNIEEHDSPLRLFASSPLRLALSRSVSLTTGVLTIGYALAQNPFVPRDQFDELPSDAWRYLTNMGQVFDVAGNVREDVYFHSVGTFPTIYAMGGNRLAIVVPKDDPTTHENDSIKRVDLAFTGPNAKQSIPFLWEPTPKRYHFYEQFTPQGILDVTGGKRVIYEDM